MNKLIKYISSKKNTIAIAIGLLGGQGVWFAFGAYSLANGKDSYFAQLGIGISIATLLIFLVEMGSSYSLQQIAASTIAAGRIRFLSLLLIRIGMAIICTAIVFIALRTFNSPWTTVLLCCTPGVLISSIGIQGLVDYYGRNAIVSPAQALPWILASCGALSSSFLENSFILPGIGFSIGYAIYIALQWAVCRNEVPSISMTHFTVGGVRDELSSSLSLVFLGGVAQLYPRIVLLVVEKYFSSSILAAILLARTLSQGVMQLISAHRRVVFKTLLFKSQKSSQSFFQIIKDDSFSYIFSAFVIIGTIASSTIIDFPFNTQWPIGVSILSLVFVWVLPSSLGQILIASQNQDKYLKTTLVSVVSALALLGPSLLIFGPYGVVTSEMLMFVMQAYFCLRVLRSIGQA